MTLDFGITPRTEAELEDDLYTAFTNNGYSGTREQFAGSNLFQLFQLGVFPQIRNLESLQIVAISNLFEYLLNTDFAIRQVSGASFGGFTNCFKPYCTGVKVFDQNDNSNIPTGSVLVSLDTVNDTVGLGNAFIANRPVCLNTLTANSSMVVNHSDGRAITFNYNNITQTDYTLIKFRVTQTPKAGTAPVLTNVIQDYVKQWADVNLTIGENIYLNTIFSSSVFSNTANFNVSVSVDGGTTWSTDDTINNMTQRFYVDNAASDVEVL